MAFSFLEFPIYAMSHCTQCPNEPRSPLRKEQNWVVAILENLRWPLQEFEKNGKSCFCVHCFLVYLIPKMFT